MNILIIGGHSFLGRQLKADLERKLNFVKIYTSTERKQLANTSSIHVNYQSLKSVTQLLSSTKPEYIIHLASYCIRDSSDKALQRGKTRDDNILNSLISSKCCPKIIFVSSMAVFSLCDKEIDPSRHEPQSNYGLEKSYMIKKLNDTASKYSEFSYKIIYPSSIYGKGQSGPMFLPRLYDYIKNDVPMIAYGANKKRDFIHVKDVSNALTLIVLDYESNANIHIFVHSFKLFKMSSIASYVCNICKINPIAFQDSEEDVKKDISEFQMVSEAYRKKLVIPKTIDIYEGLKEMFDD